MLSIGRGIVAGIACIVLLAACQNLGTKLEVGDLQLYYTARVTPGEANDLISFLVSHQSVKRAGKTMRLDKQRDTYILRVTVSSELARDESFVNTAQFFALTLSDAVFHGAKVEVDLCNRRFKTLRAAPQKDLGTRLALGKNTLFFTSRVTGDEAKRLGDYLSEKGFARGQNMTYQLDKEGNAYLFRVVVKRGSQWDADYLGITKAMAYALSKDVFHGAAVKVLLCDETLKTLHVVEPT